MFKCRRALLLLSTILVCENVQFNLYDTKLFSGSSWDHDCIYYYVHNDMKSLGQLKRAKVYLVHQIIPYCLRPIDRNISKFNLTSFITQHLTFPFEDLRSQHISSYQLYTWSASIDVAEKYELYLNEPTTNDELLFFHNCTLPWFGDLCQYTFDFETDYSVADIVEATFTARKELKKIDNFSCYIHLDCIRGPSPICLDWREICDGSMDCFDGIDEKNCWKIDINECEEHEYRCHNGQCIPEEYLLDDLWNPECIDNTDELVSHLPLLQCISDPAMRCEDHVCPPLRYASSFACGDGQCVQANQIANLQCQNGRDILWVQSIIDDTTNSSDECIWVMICISNIFPPAMYGIDCNKLCQYNGCRNIIKSFCPEIFEFPAYPVIFGHVYFIYANDELEYIPKKKFLPSYICYDEQLCIDFLPATKHINGRACRRYNETVLTRYSYVHTYAWYALILDVKYVFQACLSIHHSVYEEFRNHSEMFHCINSSKLISKHRLVDGYRDCPANDDEIVDACAVKNEYRFKCSKMNNNNNSICMPPFRVMDGYKSCPDFEDGRVPLLYNTFVRPNLSLIDFNDFWSSYQIQKYNFFPHICNGIKQFTSIFIDGQYHTDETECENWPCNNIYSQCDTVWNCKNGMDELNCRPSKCPYLHHLCVSPITLNLTCLPIAKAGDGIIDCLGATDELQQCQVESLTTNIFRCKTIRGDSCLRLVLLCNEINDCLLNDDEKFCQHYMAGLDRLCTSHKHDPNRSEEENFLCSLNNMSPQIKEFFTLGNLTNYVTSFETKTEHQFKQNFISVEKNFQLIQQCKRGLRVRVFSEDNNNTYKCLCPPAYYGHTCEYQNQRVSLTVQIRTISNWKTTFTIVFLLINNEDQTIESYDKIEFISIQDCGVKYHINLLYSTRPKDEMKNYSIRADVFDRHSMKYRGSWDYPVLFPFLPVNRMAIILIIPAHEVESTCNTLNCGFYGRCLKFVNSNETFCKCNDEWSGKGCTKMSSLNIRCASGSLTVGRIHNRSICVCPLGRFGSHCYLKHPSCPNDPCQNSGVCFLTDERMPNLKLICICKEGFSGTNCEIRNTKIDVSLENLPIPSAILMHFITAHGNKPESRATIFQKIPVDQTSTTAYISSMFHLIYIEYFHTLYFAYLQHTYTSGETIKTIVKPSHRCPSINELFHANITKLHQLRRVKHYPIVCQQQSNLLCFYDDSYICFCYNNGTPNCFIFNHSIIYNCQGYNYCQNGGRCFQNDIVCPTSSMCECIDCFYGSRCQFSSQRFELSLDLILGPHIRPKNYSFVFQISICIVLLLTVFGLINNILSVLTFQTKKSRNSSSGLYLLSSSITSILIIIIFSFKFWLLVLSQKMIITNRSILFVQCLLIDFLLRISLNIESWLNSCVSVERVHIIIKGVQFNNTKSKRIYKWIVFILILFNIITTIQDPIFRQLVDDEDDQRTWCVVEYSSLLQIFNSSFYLLHFLIPFMINLMSALIIIIRLAQQAKVSHSHQNFREYFQKQLNEHKHLLVSPVILVILSLPRLIISFLPGCMKSFREPWFFLMSYFVSFIPTLVSFITFVLPSDMYKKEFLFAFRRLKQRFRQNY